MRFLKTFCAFLALLEAQLVSVKGKGGDHSSPVATEVNRVILDGATYINKVRMNSTPHHFRRLISRCSGS